MKTILRIEELQDIQGEIEKTFFRKECTVYEANWIITQLTERIHKITQDKKLHEVNLEQNHNRVEFAYEIQDDDIVAYSIQKIVNEILAEIGDIFVREKLFASECEMILDALEEIIKKNRRTKDNKARRS